jgi:hypothetical protein
MNPVSGDGRPGNPEQQIVADLGLVARKRKTSQRRRKYRRRRTAQPEG